METLKYDNDFLIDSNYPHQIINKHTNKPLTEYQYNDEYISVLIKGKHVKKHRLIAQQFIENNDPTNLQYVDHIDNNKHNNAITNLRWVTHSDNMYNRNHFTKQQYEYLDTMPENVSEIIKIRGVEYYGYYFDHDNKRILKQTLFNKGNRIKIINPTKSGNRIRIVLTDINGTSHTYSYNKLITDLESSYD